MSDEQERAVGNHLLWGPIDPATYLPPEQTVDALRDAILSGVHEPSEVEFPDPASTWTIPHNLGRRPGVSLYVNNEPIDTDYEATDSLVVVTWPEPTAGSAVLT